MRATSKSWMLVAPFIAMAVTAPRRIRSIRTGLRPHLTTCPPIMAITGLPRRRAETTASTTARSPVAARIRGRES